MVTRCSNNGCCEAHQIPLRTCKACTVDKFQGQTVGSNSKFFTKVVVAMPNLKTQNNRPGLELTALSRACELSNLAIYTDDGEVTYEHFMKIGKGAIYDKRRAFDEKLKSLANVSEQTLRHIITVTTENGKQSFDEGYKSLVDSYRGLTVSTQKMKLSVKKHMSKYDLPEQMQQLTTRVDRDFGYVLSDIAKSLIPEYVAGCIGS